VGAADSVKPDEKPETRWHLSLIPLYMAIGSPGLLVTLAVLSLGANVADIGVMIAAGAAASIVLSAVWGGLSDFSGRRRGYLLLFFTILGPIFLALSMANSVPQLILLYTVLVGITSGVAPIAVMYTVECCKGKNWQGGVARYNSITSVGNILGLLTYTVVAQFYETHWLFFISAVMCFLAVILFWRTGHEPEMTLERYPFQVRIFRDAERFFSPKPILHYLDIRRFKIPKNLKQLKPLQLLFLAAFVHWVGINFFGVGQTPLMRALGLSDSLILAVNCAAGVAQAIAFVRIAPRMNSGHKRLLNRVVVVRGSLILCWAALPIFFFYPASFVFIFPLIISIVWSVFYAIIWLPITNFAISQASADRKGSVQGELLSAVGVGNAIGSAFGGLVITAYGYTVGFVLASIIAMLAIPIISRIDIIE
jgi:MFS family permease